MRKKHEAFTLIELLIVVAIIAILAMIAVPNFLEAQTRAKVSRVRTDLRTLAVAEEAYRVDWNSYTHSNSGTENPFSYTLGGRWAGFRELTTPVAYITSIPLEVFAMLRSQDAQGLYRSLCYELGTGDSGAKQGSGPPWNSNRKGMPSDCYEIESTGPDHWDNTRGSYSTGDFPWGGINANDPVPILAMIYDPTNGTVSRGEIFRVGGQIPAGLAFQVLWANASR